MMHNLIIFSMIDMKFYVNILFRLSYFNIIATTVIIKLLFDLYRSCWNAWRQAFVKQEWFLLLDKCIIKCHNCYPRNLQVWSGWPWRSQGHVLLIIAKYSYLNIKYIPVLKNLQHFSFTCIFQHILLMNKNIIFILFIS